MSGLSHELFYSAGLTNFAYQLSVEVSLVRMPPRRIIESSFKAVSKRSCQHVEMKLQRMKGYLGGGGDTNGMSNFIFTPPRISFLISLCGRFEYPVLSSKSTSITRLHLVKGLEVIRNVHVQTFAMIKYKYFQVNC